MKKERSTKIIVLTFLTMAFIIIANLSSAFAQISVVVSSSSSNTATAAQLKEMFSGSRLTWKDGTKIQIAHQPDSDTGKQFYDKFIGKTANTVLKKWTKLSLSGQANAPVKCVNDDDVKKAVAKGKNIVGFIKTSSLDGTVKEIHKINN
ncbi:hypothetical protein ACFL7D_03095 [candidate division KSB1 bacterium]